MWELLPSPLKITMNLGKAIALDPVLDPRTIPQAIRTISALRVTIGTSNIARNMRTDLIARIPRIQLDLCRKPREAQRYPSACPTAAIPQTSKYEENREIMQIP